ncbi:hypothetical protein GCM10023220_37030 [Streptomyces ziwulingensis]|uniref:Uncharacterized protein n=1 Tax=Streptomyces ziwulingensis TaxID=1045501 RepID=A0ABP9C5P8_9ACTN
MKICETAGVWAGNVSAREGGDMAGNLGALFSAVNERNKNRKGVDYEDYSTPTMTCAGAVRSCDRRPDSGHWDHCRLRLFLPPSRRPAKREARCR